MLTYYYNHYLTPENELSIHDQYLTCKELVKAGLHHLTKLFSILKTIMNLKYLFHTDVGINDTSIMTILHITE